MRGRAASRRIVDVDRIRAARNGVGKLPRAQHVIGRQRVAPLDAARLADTDLRAGRGDARILESRHALAEELQQLHHLQARLDLGARKVDRIERIDIRHACHVHGHLVGIRRDEKRNQFARDIDESISLRLRPQVVQSRDGRQRMGGTLVRLERGAHLIGMHPHVGGGLREIDVAETKHQTRRLHAPALIALLRRHAGRCRDVRVGGRIDDHTRAITAAAANRCNARADDAIALDVRAEKPGVQQQLRAGFAHHFEQQRFVNFRIERCNRRNVIRGVSDVAG